MRVGSFCLLTLSIALPVARAPSVFDLIQNLFPKPPPPPPPPPTYQAADFLASLVVALLLVVLVHYARNRLRTARGDAATGTPHTLADMLRREPLLATLGDPEIAAAVEALEAQTYKEGEAVYAQDDEAHHIFFVVAGECRATSRVHTLLEGTRVSHKKRGVGVILEVKKNPNITKVAFDAENGAFHKYTPASLHKLKPVEKLEPRVEEVGRYAPGGVQFFGAFVLHSVSVFGSTRAETVTCTADATVLRLSADTFKALRHAQDHKENRLRGVSLFETYDDDQIAALASVLRPMEFAEGAALVVQGEEGHDFYLLDEGECVAKRRIEGGDEQEVMRYQPGDLFAEKALLEKTFVRGATITAVNGPAKVWALGCKDFEAKLGNYDKLKAEQYLTDPRRLIATFYGKGDGTGPAGALASMSSTPQKPTSWFAVYRPCSRDSIAKMLGRQGTGKGLNIKGKSAKKNRLSGFVPFCQISKNEDKEALEVSPRDARTHVYYQSDEARDTARKIFASALEELQVEKGAKLLIDKQEVLALDEHVSTGAYGLDVPELLLKDVYIVRSDVSPAVGWETGRDSEPAFLDMNLHATRDGAADKTSPKVVLYQFDRNAPMNPRGLLMAYSEARVMPVVSDFDTFLVGSKGIKYDPTPPEQVELMSWALTHTTELLAEPNGKGWMGRWLHIIKEEARAGFHPPLPPYGFGDPTSYSLIGKIVDATGVCGAVRHGAECFNFYFPQELDPDFLIVWDGLSAPPWKPVDEKQLRTFLLERAKEGFSFPINPVWPVRDPGWLEVLHALEEHDEARANLRSWFPPESGVQQRILGIAKDYPEGFRLHAEDTVFDQVDDAVKAGKSGKQRVAGSFYKNMVDVSTRDMANFAELEVRRETKMRWRRIRSAMLMHLLEGGPAKSRVSASA